MSSTSDSAIAWPIAHRPVPSSETSTIGGLAGALAVEQRTHDPAGDRHGADGVAEARAGGTGTRSYSGRLAPTAMPARAQKASES